MNDKTPREEWTEGPNGQMRGPWQGQHVVYLLDPKTMDKYSFPTGTTGGKIAVRELRDKTMWMRRLRGPNVYAVITLADVFMNTKFGGRQRPSFKIVRWARLGGEGGEGGEVEALPPPPTPRPTQQPAQMDLPLVAEPSLAEQMDDEIPTFDDPPQQTTPPLKTPAPSAPKPNARTTTRRNLKKSAQKPAKPAGKKQNILDAG